MTTGIFNSFLKLTDPLGTGPGATPWAADGAANAAVRQNATNSRRTVMAMKPESPESSLGMNVAEVGPCAKKIHLHVAERYQTCRFVHKPTDKRSVPWERDVFIPQNAALVRELGPST